MQLYVFWWVNAPQVIELSRGRQVSPKASKLHFTLFFYWTMVDRRTAWRWNYEADWFDANIWHCQNLAKIESCQNLAIFLWAWQEKLATNQSLVNIWDANFRHQANHALYIAMFSYKHYLIIMLTKLTLLIFCDFCSPHWVFLFVANFSGNATMQ